MTIAIDTNVLVRLLVRDDAAQFTAAARLVQQAETAGQPLLILLGALLETEWVLRSRYRLDKPAIANTFARLLEVDGVVFEHEATVEEALYIWTQHTGADFADCLLNARAAHLGCTRFVTFDAGASKLPRAELLTS
ncbi:type II toxin-antitoxin system VapC family toxin [Roseateles asaccharophilus]|uniref:Ribonuclease VapC n=1 Tax=Roseateles asaccharophilus TaxID=582607 RepID=A0ABU2AEW4_9BURK|nr:type II toxin-antitoxin system VapC family toxin [Roseateles asaccharophilus]MDR7335635.1 putative nucleic-acid-binding protein [Roseateles asaccharophilus]